MSRKRASLMDNPTRCWFRVEGRIIRILSWDNIEPTETSQGKIPPKQWWVLRKSKQLGVHLKNYELWYPDWLKKLAIDLLAGNAIYFQ